MRRVFGIFVLLLALGAGIGFSHAADSYQVNSGASTDITEHTVCKRVTNNHASGAALYVPTKTVPEWSAFYNATAAGISVGTCGGFGTPIADSGPICPNGDVTSVFNAGDRTIIAGTFTATPPCSGSGVPISTSTAALTISQSALQAVNGAINAVVSDGSGGWYIGGTFTKVGSTTRNYIAQINSDGTLNAWNPNANGNVNALILYGSTLYVGGEFTTIGGQTRRGIAALSTSTGNASSFDPASGVTFQTKAMALTSDGATLYVSGNGSVQSKSRVAAIVTSTGIVTSFSAGTILPGGGAFPQAMVLSADDTTLYVGGNFTAIGGQTRNYLAALDASTGNATSWDPALDYSVVYALALSGTTLYVGGTFNSVNSGATNRSGLAAFDTSTGNVTSWNPGAYDTRAITVSGSNVYVGGGFTTAGGQSRNYLAAIDSSTGLATSWNPDLGGSSNKVYALAVSGSTLYAGGDFKSIARSTPTRNRIAVIETDTGKLTTWNPGIANGQVNAMALYGSTLYIAGTFTSTVGGSTRSRVAALDIMTDTNNVTSWNPGMANGLVNTIALSADGSVLYVGGTFTSTVGGATRTRLAALNTGSNTATNWNPTADGEVKTMALSGTTLYIGGTFANAGGAARARVAALDTTTDTNNATAWNPGVANGVVYTMLLSGSDLYIGGSFTSTVGGSTRARIARLSTGSDTVTSWSPGVNGGLVSDMALLGTTLYIGGTFSGTVGGQSRSYLAAISTTSDTSNATSWNPAPAALVNDLAVSSSYVHVGGTLGIASPPRTSYATIGISDGVAQ